MGRTHTATSHAGYEGGPHGYAHGAHEIEDIMRNHPEQVNYWDYVEHPQYFADYWGVNKQFIPGFLQAGLQYTGMIDGQTIDTHPDVEIGTGFAAVASGRTRDESATPLATGNDIVVAHGSS
mmetsp:Transcript_6020/g.15399  ORF Transcript_6020/g.15399 Transcript_6020/m.15399 type:complete len:122 (+) Transcript_6020:91-456(+)